VGLPRKALLSHLPQPISGLLPNSRQSGSYRVTTPIEIAEYDLCFAKTLRVLSFAL
jgi:hypothetical protein